MIPAIRNPQIESNEIVRFFLEKGEGDGIIYLMGEEDYIKWAILEIDSDGIYLCKDIESKTIPTDEEGRIKIRGWK